MRVTIEKIVYTGKSLARHDGKVIFVDGGLPDEVLEVELLKEKKNYTEAILKEVVKASPQRVEPRCNHYKICSPYQNIEYVHQAEIKKIQLKEFFSHNLKLEPEIYAFRSAQNPWGYRNKLHLKVIHNSEGSFLAYNKTHSVTEFSIIDRCYLASDDFNNLLDSIIELIRKYQLLSVESVSVRKSLSFNKYLLSFYGKGESSKLSPLKELFEYPDVAGVVFIGKKSGKKVLLAGNDFVDDSIANRIFRIGPESFFQINPPMLELMLKDIRDFVTTSKVASLVDVYCGLGTFGILLSDIAEQVTGIELYPDNLKFLKVNVRLNSLSNYKIAKGDAGKILPEILETEPDVLIIDPPRRGVGATVCAEICKNAPKKLVYISCDPATLTRDLKNLFPRFKLKALYGYDFFPNTTHIEQAVFLERT